jgi:hypothetical protein
MYLLSEGGGEYNKWNGGTKGACEKSKILEFDSTSNSFMNYSGRKRTPM